MPTTREWLLLALLVGLPANVAIFGGLRLTAHAIKWAVDNGYLPL